MPIKDPEKRRAYAREYNIRYRAKPGIREKRNAQKKARYDADPEKHREAQRKRVRANPELYNSLQKEWREAHPEAQALVRRRSQLKKHGMTIEDYDRRHAEQKGLCCICGQPETCVRQGAVMRLAVEHCHKTGRVRGLTCNRCNRTMGMAGDDPKLLRALADYLSDG